VLTAPAATHTHRIDWPSVQSRNARIRAAAEDKCKRPMALPQLSSGTSRSPIAEAVCEAESSLDIEHQCFNECPLHVELSSANRYSMQRGKIVDLFSTLSSFFS
jgi:hypothetical protein